jgi:hypothetical protein
MLPSQELDIAVAKVKHSDWEWRLRIDQIGIYRWYLSGRIPTKVKGTTRTAAESALARFVKRTLRDELEIKVA